MFCGRCRWTSTYCQKFFTIKTSIVCDNYSLTIKIFFFIFRQVFFMCQPYLELYPCSWFNSVENSVSKMITDKGVYYQRLFRTIHIQNKSLVSFNFFFESKRVLLSDLVNVTALQHFSWTLDCVWKKSCWLRHKNVCFWFATNLLEMNLNYDVILLNNKSFNEWIVTFVSGIAEYWTVTDAR